MAKRPTEEEAVADIENTRTLADETEYLTATLKRRRAEEAGMNAEIQKGIDLGAESLRQQQEEIHLLEDELAGLEKGSAAWKEKNAQRREKIRIMAKDKVANDNLIKQKKDIAKATLAYGEAIDGVVESMVGMLGLSGKIGKSFKNLTKLKNEAGGWGNLAKDLGRTFKANIGAAAGSAVLLLSERIVSAAFELDALAVGFTKATGMSRSMSNEMTGLSVDMLSLGVSMEHGQAAGNALYSQMTSFQKQSESTRSTLVKTTAMLENMGVSSQETAGNIQFMTASLGMSGN